MVIHTDPNIELGDYKSFLFVLWIGLNVGG